MILVRLLTLPVRLAAGAARAGWRLGRVAGTGRAVAFGAGVAVGVLVASPKARQAVLVAASGVADKVAERRRTPVGAATAPTAGPAAIDASD